MNIMATVLCFTHDEDASKKMDWKTFSKISDNVFRTMADSDTKRDFGMVRAFIIGLSGMMGWTFDSSQEEYLDMCIGLKMMQTIPS